MIAYIIQRKTDKNYVYDIDWGRKTTFKFCEPNDNYRIPKLFSRYEIDRLFLEGRLAKKYRVIQVVVKKVVNTQKKNKEEKDGQ